MLGHKHKPRRTVRTKILLYEGQAIPFTRLTRESATGPGGITVFYDTGEGERSVTIPAGRIKPEHVEAIRSAVRNRTTK